MLQSGKVTTPLLALLVSPVVQARVAPLVPVPGLIDSVTDALLVVTRLPNWS